MQNHMKIKKIIMIARAITRILFNCTS